MAKKRMQLQTGGFGEWIERLDAAGKDVKAVVEDALTQAGETIADDTLEAVKKGNLPQKGKYSKGDTEKSVIRKPKVEWEGQTASIAVGFDHTKPGAGLLLITGTPKMPPDNKLKRIYQSRKYMQGIESDIKEVVSDAVNKTLGG